MTVKASGSRIIKGLKIEDADTQKSPLAPLCQRGVMPPFVKGGWEGFYELMSSLL
jgi:hypothetical protein